MFTKIIGKVLGSKSEREWKRAQPLIDEVNGLCDEMNDLDDAALRERTSEFRKRLDEGEDLEELLPEAFAVSKQVCRRLLGHEYDVCGKPMVWNMVPYDVQIFGGWTMHRGRIAEMATGEGKTLAAVAPVYLNALTGRGVHLVTVNDYLARRDADWMRPVYERLGITVGCIQHDMDPPTRREQYACDVTYGTNNEFGFDHLRDNMAIRKEDQVQRPHYFAIVDEVDSVLIDEARTPLIISGPVTASDRDRFYGELRSTVDSLVRKQREMCARWVREAESVVVDEDVSEDDRYDAGRKLLLVRRGMPKNKRLLRLYKEQGVQKLIGRVEADYMREKQIHVLDEELLFSIDEKGHTVSLSDDGIQKLSSRDQELFLIPDVAELLGEVDSRTDLDASAKIAEKERVEREAAENAAKVHCIQQLLRAFSLYEKDVEYVVQEGKVMIVDTFTGRLMPGRRWSDGLHQAVEAKEGVKIEGENQTLATITLQNYFRMYDKLAGMTGTAETEAFEFFEIYELEVHVIPTNEPIRRQDVDDLIYRTRREKYNAVVEEIEYWHKRKRPILVGTVSVEVSETLSRMLKRNKIPHSVLNAKFHEQEANIVLDAGQPGAVTIATNMAGRGTDIKLGEGVVGCDRDCAFVKSYLDDKSGASPNPDGFDCTEELGCGLHIIGTERHEARRIDRQLRGRSGRQGDPGASRFYLSLEDDLMRLFGSERISAIMDRLGVEEGEVIEHPMVTKSIERAQRKVEERNFEMRKRLLEYDDVMNRQREVIYARRAQALEGEDLREEILRMIEEEAEAIVDDHVDPSVHPEKWDWDMLGAEVGRIFLERPELSMRADPKATREEILDELIDVCTSAYEARESNFSPELMRQVERAVYLQTVDRLWKDHLYEMDQLKGGIGLRGYGQRDPLVEYKKEGYGMFVRLLGQLSREVLSVIFRARLEAPPPPRATTDPAMATASRGPSVDDPRPVTGPPPPAGRPPRATGAPLGGVVAPGLSDRTKESASWKTNTSGGAPQQKVPVKAEATVGRNDPCSCGSGRKYKKCCGVGG